MLSPSMERHGRLQGFMGAIAQDPDNKTEAFTTEFPVTVPDSVEERQTLLDTLMDLFENAFVSMKRGRVAGQKDSGRNIYRDAQHPLYPIPGTPHETVNDSEVGILRELLSSILPDPSDPDFAVAIRHRTAGIISLLGLIVDLQANHGDTGSTLSSTVLLTRPMGEQRPVDVPWTVEGEDEEGATVFGRRKQFERRAGSILEQMKTANLMGKNSDLRAETDEKLEEIAPRELRAARKAFETGCDRFAGTVNNRVRWTHVLLTGLAALGKAENAALRAKDALSQLTIDLTAADKKEDFTKAVDEFNRAMREPQAH